MPTVYDEEALTRRDVEETIPALARKAFHLPGHSWCQDYMQYFGNTHPIFGICCHHPKHPIDQKVRIVHLLGSIFFGLAVTNIIWLWFIFDEKHDANDPILTVSLGGIVTNETLAELEEDPQVYEITEGMVLLWTVGGGLHALYDNTVWYLTACLCCLPGQKLSCLYRFRWCGTYFVVLSVVLCTAVATFVVVLRAAVEGNMDEVADSESGGLVDDSIDLAQGFDSKDSYRFLISYGVELALALLVYFPLMATVLFSGILGCGRVPVLGGRPYEVSQEEKRKRRESETVSRKSQSFWNSSSRRSSNLR